MLRSWVFLLLVIAGGLSLVFGPRSGLQWFRLYKAQRILEQEILEQKKLVAELQQKASDLSSNPFAQMKAIRESLGYVHKKDILFEFVEVQNDKSQR